MDDPQLAAFGRPRRPNTDNGNISCAFRRLDAGDDSAAPPLDQRGYVRSGVSDIGAFEYGGHQVAVQVFAVGPTASEDGDVGLFFVTRNTTSGTINVNYTISGNATNGLDYVTITNFATIPNGSFFGRVIIRAIQRGIAETNKTVTLTVGTGTGYNTGSATTATVFISDHSTFNPTQRYVRGNQHGARRCAVFRHPSSISRLGVALATAAAMRRTCFPATSGPTHRQPDA